MRILVIEDDAGLRRTVSLLLEGEDYEVATAGDGSVGLEKAAEWNPEVILADVRMPGMDGLEFVEQYAATGGGASVIIMTAYGNPDTAIEAIRRGAFDYIDKPFAPDALLLRVRIADGRIIFGPIATGADREAQIVGGLLECARIRKRG